MKRRKFIQQTSLSVLATQLPQNNSAASHNGEVNWKAVAKQFRHNKNTINFNSGSSGVLSKKTIALLNQNTLALAALSPYKTFEKWKPVVENIKNQLAESLTVNTSELAIVNNTTEAINFVLCGYKFTDETEVLFAKHDYPYVKNTIKNLSKIKPLQYKELDVNIELLTDEAIIKYYEAAINKKTKLLVLSHITYAIGRILPIKKIIEVAHKNNVEVLLDAAHSYAHIKYSIADLNCDYYATSLHKWLNAPYGTGLLYVKKDKIKNIQTPVNAFDFLSDDINKFQELGTRAFQNMVSIMPALSFHKQLSISIKQKRLIELSNYFIEKLKLANIKNLEIVTDKNLMKYGGIVTFKVTDKSSIEIVNTLYQKYGIIAKSIGLYIQSGIRISNNIFILKKNIDHLIEAITTTCKTI